MFRKALFAAALLFFFSCKNDKTPANTETAQEIANPGQQNAKPVSQEEVDAVKKQCFELSDELAASARAMDAIVSKMPKNEQYKQAFDLLESMQGMVEKTRYLKEAAGTLGAVAVPNGDGQSLTSSGAPSGTSDQVQSTVAELKVTMESVRGTMQDYIKQFEAITGKKVQ